MSGTVIIEVTPGNTDALIRSPYTAREIIKAFPARSRRWDKDARCWLITTTLVQQLATALRAAEFTVRITGMNVPDNPRPRTTWADHMYSALGIPLADTVHKALIRVLHPDAGGDAEAMKTLNAARDRAYGRNTR